MCSSSTGLDSVTLVWQLIFTVSMTHTHTFQHVCEDVSGELYVRQGTPSLSVSSDSSWSGVLD